MANKRSEAASKLLSKSGYDGGKSSLDTTKATTGPAQVPTGLERARGGRAPGKHGKTEVNVIVGHPPTPPVAGSAPPSAAPHPAPPPPSGVAGGGAPVGMPGGMAGMPPGMPPGAGPAMPPHPGMPPGMPPGAPPPGAGMGGRPPGLKKGGRVPTGIAKAGGAGSGESRLARSKAVKRHT
jgi:hypothetical protein